MKVPHIFLLFTLILSHPRVYCQLVNIPLDYNSLRNHDYSDIQSIQHPLSFTELAAQYGHPAESHEVITEDGYILTLFRIRGNRRALPILLLHGVTDSADTWIVRGDTSLAVTLASRGYDVWLGNARGSRYSRRHVSLNPDVDAGFWDFTFTEHGLFDLPANIDYILNATGAEKLNMFGHSQGNVIIWVLLSTRTEYNDKINVATALAPVCYLQYVPPPVGVLIRLVPTLYPLFRSIGFLNIFGDDSIGTLLFRAIARVPYLGYLVDAYGFIFATSGVDSTELGPEFLPNLTLHYPTWTSTKNLVHFAQVGSKNVFARFDYGDKGNLAAYNATTPPAFELGNVRTRVVLLAAINDKFAPLADVEMLRRRLPNVVRYVIIPRLTMNHVDFVWGKTAPTYLYRYIFDVLENYA